MRHLRQKKFTSSLISRISIRDYLFNSVIFNLKCPFLREIMEIPLFLHSSPPLQSQGQRASESWILGRGSFFAGRAPLPHFLSPSVSTRSRYLLATGVGVGHPVSLALRPPRNAPQLYSRTVISAAHSPLNWQILKQSPLATLSLPSLPVFLARFVVAVALFCRAMCAVSRRGQLWQIREKRYICGFSYDLSGRERAAARGLFAQRAFIAVNI